MSQVKSINAGKAAQGVVVPNTFKPNAENHLVMTSQPNIQHHSQAVNHSDWLLRIGIAC